MPAGPQGCLADRLCERERVTGMANRILISIALKVEMELFECSLATGERASRREHEPAGQCPEAVLSMDVTQFMLKAGSKLLVIKLGQGAGGDNDLGPHQPGGRDQDLGPADENALLRPDAQRVRLEPGTDPAGGLPAGV